MTYVRPRLDLGEFRDERGVLIDYGSRWGSGQPPEDAYSVTAHPERFRPLYDVAEALIGHLVTTYDVRVEEEIGQPDWLDLRIPVSRSVTIRPHAPGAATLQVALTDFPGVVLRAGSVQEPAPHCGCDACDDDVLQLADELEGTVLAIAGGTFVEYSDGWEITFPNGSGRAAGLREPPVRSWAAWLTR
jgi:hypothetical protein